MQHEPKQLNNIAPDWELTTAEKAQMRERLLLFIKRHPVIYGQIQRHQLWSLNVINNFKLSFFKPMPILITLALLFSGGVAFGAEKSLPGDTLYPVKVHFNEQVRGFVTFTPEAKATWEARVANRRLEEAERLAAESRLNTKARVQLEKNFEAFANKASDRIEAFEERNADKAAKIASNFETSLKAHERILLAIGAVRNGNQKPQIDALVVKIRAEAKESGNDRAKKEDQVARGTQVQAAAEGRMISAQNKIVEVSKFVESKKENLGVEAIAQAEARLKVANDTLVNGRAKLEADKYGEAFVLFGKAHAIAQEAKLLIQAKTELENHEGESEGSMSPFLSPSSVSSQSNADVESQVEIKSQNESVHSSGRIKIDLGL